jgi:hypothetical protein
VFRCCTQTPAAGGAAAAGGGGGGGGRALAAVAGATAVLGLMRAHPVNAAVQRRGCFALWCLCRNSDTSKAVVAAAGGCDAVVAAMRSQPGDAALQLNASVALRGLAGCGAPNFAGIAVAGGMKAVQSAMCAHAANANNLRSFVPPIRLRPLQLNEEGRARFRRRLERREGALARTSKIIYDHHV